MVSSTQTLAEIYEPHWGFITSQTLGTEKNLKNAFDLVPQIGPLTVNTSIYFVYIFDLFFTLSKNSQVFQYWTIPYWLYLFFTLIPVNLKGFTSD